MDWASVHRLGLLADIQYADVADGSDFSGREIRRYRGSLDVVSRAIRDRFTRASRPVVQALINLGDIVDGKAKPNFAQDFAKVEAVLDELQHTASPPPPRGAACSAEGARGATTPVVPAFVENEPAGGADPGVPEGHNWRSVPRLDLIGNHELYCAPRSVLRTCLRGDWTDGEHLYYARTVGGGRFRLLFVDGYVEATMGYDKEDNPFLLRGKARLGSENPHVLAGPGDWFSGVPVEKHKFVPYNGALGDAQRDWLRTELRDSFFARQYVVFFSHIPLYAADPEKQKTILWDSEEIFALLAEEVSGAGGVRNAAHVIVFVAGHAHSFASCVDDRVGVTHVVLSSPMLTPPGGECCAVLDLSLGEDASGRERGCVHIQGFGMPSVTAQRCAPF